jgi:Tfp pilus assembly protein PilV
MSLLRVSKGMGMVEVIIAMFLAAVAVMALFSLQAPALRTTAQADYLGRAAEILHRQLESTEVYLMNVCNSAAIPLQGVPAIPAAGASLTSTYNVRTSGLGADTNGDATYSVSTTITSMPPVPPSVTPTYFRVVVNVTWILNTTGISQTIFVSRQEYYKAGC